MFVEMTSNNKQNAALLFLCIGLCFSDSCILLKLDFFPVVFYCCQLYGTIIKGKQHYRTKKMKSGLYKLKKGLIAKSCSGGLFLIKESKS